MMKLLYGRMRAAFYFVIRLAIAAVVLAVITALIVPYLINH